MYTRSRKRLFVSISNDYLFDIDDISSKRITEYKCRGKISIYTDDWQETPYQRIS